MEWKAYYYLSTAVLVDGSFNIKCLLNTCTNIIRIVPGGPGIGVFTVALCSNWWVLSCHGLGCQLYKQIIDMLPSKCVDIEMKRKTQTFDL